MTKKLTPWPWALPYKSEDEANKALKARIDRLSEEIGPHLDEQPKEACIALLALIADTVVFHSFNPSDAVAKGQELANIFRGLTLDAIKEIDWPTKSNKPN